MLCSALTARVLDLPLGNTLLGALVAGIPSAICVLIGAHTVGEVLAVIIFAFWCARAPGRQVAVR